MTAPDSWVNFDSSPTLRLERISGYGLVRKRIFPKNVKYGDIVKGLPIDFGTCDGIYCSHVLEHLTKDDALRALRFTIRYLKTGGVFRLVVPDLERITSDYLALQKSSHWFMEESGLGLMNRPEGVEGVLRTLFGASRHQWMWDEPTLHEALIDAGFVDIRRAEFNDSTDPMFRLVEDERRFIGCLAVECSR